MQQSALSTIGLPLALAIIMRGLGLHLRLDDFRRIVSQLRAMQVGLACQALQLPALFFVLCKAWGLTGPLAVGMMLLAASPGGITANLYSHLFKGHVAQNISLTSINSVSVIVSIPLIVNASLLYFMGNEQVIPLQFQKTLEVMLLILLPVGLGMLIHAKFPAIAQRMNKAVKIASALVLVVMIVLILQREWELVVANFQLVGSACLAFSIDSMAVGYGAGHLARLSEGQNRAIAVEIGIHNGALATYPALAVLNDGGMAIPEVMYSLLMFCTAAVFGAWVARRG